jgi:hypothetical protein
MTAMRLTAAVDVRAAGKKRPSFAIAAYSGRPIVPEYRYAPLPVIMELSGLRAANPLPVLLDHNATAAGIVGQGKAEITASGVFVVVSNRRLRAGWHRRAHCG